MLRRRLCASVIALMLAVLLSYVAASTANAESCSGSAAVPEDKASRGQATRAILCLVNRARAARGIRAVRLSSELGLAARRHSGDMVARKYFGHESPGGDNLADRVRRSGYAASHPGFSAGEALAWGTFASPDVLMQALLQSPVHRAIVLDRSARDVGLGLTLGAPQAGVTDPSATLTLVTGE